MKYFFYFLIAALTLPAFASTDAIQPLKPIKATEIANPNLPGDYGKIKSVHSNPVKAIMLDSKFDKSYLTNRQLANRAQLLNDKALGFAVAAILTLPAPVVSLCLSISGLKRASAANRYEQELRFRQYDRQ